MTKKLLLFTAIFSFVVSCTDYEDDFANLNDQLDGISSQLDGIETAVEGIATIQLELLNINSAIASIYQAVGDVSDAIGELPTVADINNLAALIGTAITNISDLDTSITSQFGNLSAEMQAEFDALSAQLTSELSALQTVIENGFSGVNAYLATLDANIQIIDGEIEIIDGNVDGIGSDLVDLASAVSIIDGQVVANADALAALNGLITAQDIEIANILLSLGVIEVDLDNINADNQLILTQLASLVTLINDGFDGVDADNAQILLELTAVQTQLSTVLVQISALEVLINDLTLLETDNDNDVDAQLAALSALIEALQADLTVLLESTTTVYNDDLTIKNQAQLDYALSLDDKVMVINGVVDINSAFATGASLDSLNVVMDKMNTITKDVIIASTADLQVTNLKSVGGNYTVTGSNVSDTSLHTVAGNATYSYGTDSYTEANLVHVGGNISIVDNGSATVDFSGLDDSFAGEFKITNGTTTTNALTNATTVKLSNAIDDTNLSLTNPATTGITVNYTAAIGSTVIIESAATFDLNGAQDLSGDLDITCASLSAEFGDITATSIEITSDGQDLTVANVVTDEFKITDTGALLSASILYASVDADLFQLISTAAGTGNYLTSDGSALSHWSVNSTIISSEESVSWTHIIPEVPGLSCNAALPVTGDVDVRSTDGSVDFTFGWMVGDLKVNAKMAATVTSYQASIVDVNDVDGDSDTTENWFAVEGSVDVISSDDSVIYQNKICDPVGITYANNGQNSGDVSLTAAVDADLLAYTIYGATTIVAGNDVFVGSDFSDAWLAGSLDVSGFAGTVEFSTDIAIVGPVNVSGSGTFDGSNWNLDIPAGYQVGGDISISATAGIDLSQANELGDGQNGSYVTTLESDGNINLSAVAATSNDVTITGAGDVDLSSLATAAGTLSITANTVNLDSFVESSGDVVIDAQLNNDALPLLESFTSLIVNTETVVNLDSYVSGTITLGDATTFSSTSVDTDDLTAGALQNYTLASQVVDLTITGADLPALLSLDVTTADVAPAVGIDLISVTGTTATSISTAGNADVFVVSDNDDLTTINALHEKGDDPNGTKVHILNNTSLTGYVSNTKSMLEIRIEGNTSLTTLDLSSYLNSGAATSADTASDYALANYILRVTGNGILGTYVPIDNNGNTPTDLDSAELATAKTIALHLLSLQQPQSVVAEADFVDLVSHPNAENIGDNNTDFTDGINTIEEWTILNTP